MGLNKSGIEWTEYTWNPIVGCRHGCEYCYARELATTRIAKMSDCQKCGTFEPHFHPERLKIPGGKPKTIFFGSMADAWGDWVPPYWIRKAIMVMETHPEHTFLGLTNNPKMYLQFKLPENLWCGTTVTTRRTATAWWSMDLSYAHCRKFISFEPLLEDVGADGYVRGHFGTPPMFSAVIIGPLNKAGRDPVTRREWVEDIIDIARAAGVPIFLKDACTKIGYTMDEMNDRGLRELPWAV